MLHAVNHSLAKAMLFLVAGNILAVYRTKSTAEVRGVLRVLPASGVLWVAGLFAITGSPPFGPFLSELTILKAALDQGRHLVAIVYLVFLALIFVGMMTIVLRMAQGVAQRQPETHEPALAIIPPAALGVLVLLLGLYIPRTLQRVIEAAARALG
jgi:hydrogenase-4 component F